MTKLLKRIISAALTVVIAISSASFVSAKSVNTAEVNVRDALIGFGITADVERNADELMTRAEFCDMTVKLMNTNYIVGTYYYTDVPVGTSYADAIYTLSEMGIVSGLGDGVFAPDSPITASQVSVILVRALNYAKLAGIEFNDFYTKALSLDLFDGLKVTPNKELTYDEACRVMYNALHAPVLSWENNEYNDDYKAYESFMRCKKAVGVVTANDLTKLTKQQTLGENQVEIGGRVYTVTSGDSRSYLGMNVEYYYNDNYEIVYMNSYKNDVLTIDFKDVRDFQLRRMEYRVGTKDKIVSIASGADVIYNGVAYPEYTPSEFNFTSSNGTVRLINNDNNSDYDCIMIDEYDTLVLVNADASTETIYYSNYRTVGWSDPGAVIKRSLDLGAVGTVEIYKNDGSKIGYDTLFTNDAVSVFMSKDKSYAKLILSPDKVYGTVTSTKDDEITITRDSGEVETFGLDVRDVEDMKAMSPGYKGGFILNFEGKVSGIVSSSSEEFKYGYLMGVFYDERDRNGILIKYLSEDGKIYEKYFDKKSYLDGVRYSNLADAEALLTAIDASNGNMKYTKQQIVRYKTNTDETKLVYIDTSADGTGETDETHLETMVLSGVHFRTNERYVSHKLVLNIQGLVVFSVPVPATGVDPSEIMYAEDSEYFVTYDTKNVTSSETINGVAAITDQEGGSSTVIAITKGWTPDKKLGGNDLYSTMGTAYHGMVDSISFGLNKDGEQVPVINMIKDTDIIQVPCEYDEIARKSVWSTSGVEDTTNTVYLTRGDAISCYVDEDGIARYVNVRYDNSRPDNGRFNIPSRNRSTTSSGVILSNSLAGMKMMRLRSGAILYNPQNPLATFNENDYAVQSLLTNHTNVYVYESETDSIRKGSKYDIHSVKVNPQNPSIVVQFESYTVPSHYFIYN